MIADLTALRRAGAAIKLDVSVRANESRVSGLGAARVSGVGAAINLDVTPYTRNSLALTRIAL